MRGEGKKGRSNTTIAEKSNTLDLWLIHVRIVIIVKLGEILKTCKEIDLYSHMGIPFCD